MKLKVNYGMLYLVKGDGTKEKFSEEFIIDTKFCLENVVKETRGRLRTLYFTGGDVRCEKYRGLCDEACEIFSDLLKEKIRGLPLACAAIQVIHGELCHNPLCPSEYWPIQHTWMLVNINDEHFYVDCTSEQFSHIFPDIPDYYISKNPPKWFYPDRKNPRFNGFIEEIDRKTSIVSFAQYQIWGRISDAIRKIILL